MTGEVFIKYVKAKLNRIDTNSYLDVRPEEILFFAHQALKNLTLDFDTNLVSHKLDINTILNYLGSVTKSSTEVPVVGNKVVLPKILKLKDINSYVIAGIDKGWVSARIVNNNTSSRRQENPFGKSYPDNPAYRLINSNIIFDVDSTFNITKIKYEYIEYPLEFTVTSELTMPFVDELQDNTVTLLLETLESRRIQTQPAVSKS